MVICDVDPYIQLITVFCAYHNKPEEDEQVK
jgi:hypothetical protein